MNIIKVKKHSEKQLISKLKNISLFKNPEIKPYKKCLITLEKIAVNSLSPTQNYVLKSELQKVNNLYEQLQKFNIDLHTLNGYVSIYLEDYDEPIDVTPVIIEESFEKDGSVHLIINDGQHRMSHAGSLNIIPQVIYVRNVPKEYPYYAYPLKNGWNSGIEVLDSIPEDYVKKQYRYEFIPEGETHKFLFRNFNSQFVNSQGPRKRGN